MKDSKKDQCKALHDRYNSENELGVPLYCNIVKLIVAKHLAKRSKAAKPPGGIVIRGALTKVGEKPRSKVVASVRSRSEQKYFPFFVSLGGGEDEFQTMMTDRNGQYLYDARSICSWHWNRFLCVYA